MGSYESRREVRIASASGAVTDRRENLLELARDADVDFIVGDWMSEYNMAIRGTMKSSQASDRSQSDVDAYEHQFLDSIVDALPHLARRGIKVAVNAGASDTQKLHDRLRQIVEEQKLGLTIGWVEGDECLDVLQKYQSEGPDAKLRNITTGQLLQNWAFKPIYAQCYLGSWGITECFRHGADIVVCGRVADADPTMAAAAYWHGWGRESYAEMAHSLIAGHLIECSFYVTGGNFTGFKSLPRGASPLLNPPIARVRPDGTFFIESHKFPGRGGDVTIDTCRSQLLYELQGKRYYNSDVVAVIDEVKIEQSGPGSVYVHNIKHEKPPATTKVGITAHGGYQAEIHYFLTGLDIEEKAELLERQLRAYLGDLKFSLLKFTTSGVAASNPTCQNACTVDLRVFAQADSAETLSRRNFLEPCWNIVMSTYPGATFAVDNRQAFPKPYNEYFVTIIPLNLLNHVAHVTSSGVSIDIEAPTDTNPYRFEQDVESTTDPIALESFGPTTTAPLGYIVHARLGDKGSDANVGFYVRNEDEYPWLRSLLSVEFMIQLLQNDYNGKRIERFELPNISAVHFLLKDHLDRGVACNSTYDVLGKNLAEYLRAKHVQIPVKFLQRGRI